MLATLYGISELITTSLKNKALEAFPVYSLPISSPMTPIKERSAPLVGMCGELFGPVAHPLSANTGDEACDFCIVMAQHWRDVLTSNTTEEQFKQVRSRVFSAVGIQLRW